MVWYLDYANGWPSSGTIIANGYDGVIRYVTSPALMQPPMPGNRKHITRAEYDSHRRAGLDVWLVYQGTTTDADGGYEIGRRNALRAVEGTLSDVGPKGYDGPIFFTNDRTTLPSPVAWRNYLDGAASVIGRDRVGAYGFGNAMDAAIGHASWFWQAGRRSDVRSHVHFWQDNNVQVTVGGILCDRNLVLKAGIPIPDEPPPPPPPPVEEDMQLDDVVGTVAGRTITVRDVFLKSFTDTKHEEIIREIRQLGLQLPLPARDRFTELCDLLYTMQDQMSWNDLADLTWSELADTKWGLIRNQTP